MITLKTLPQATAQEVFDQVVTHLRTQECQSTDGFSCFYRNPNGLKCAAGCLIADDEYEDWFETAGWNTLVDSGRVPDFHRGLITNLQQIHDTYDPEDWGLQLQRIATLYDLEYKEPAGEQATNN